ncbi:MAG: L-threonylcarbamoyladenylate synthase [Paracoccaceae bacterium]
MSDQSTEILAADQPGIDRAADLLVRGQLVAFPTETVYGLGADARNDSAVAGIFETKRRPQFNPLIVHVADLDAATKFARLDDVALRLAAAFWPGPLTLVVPSISGSGLSPLVSAGLQTVAIRVPAHPLAKSLLNRFAGPVAAPSANLSGKISPTQAGHVLAGLDGKIAAVLDGGPCPIGLESTIVGLLPDPVLLRPGGLSAELIEDCLGQSLAVQGQQDTPNSPGQMASHYAPNASMRLNATKRRQGETLLGFGKVESDLNLSPASDLTEAAANLFHHLRKLDARKVEKIAVSPIPDHGLGRAINDRLQRAATPRR